MYVIFAIFCVTVFASIYFFSFHYVGIKHPQILLLCFVFLIIGEKHAYMKANAVKRQLLNVNMKYNGECCHDPRD
jgi:hypothetical protein